MQERQLPFGNRHPIIALLLLPLVPVLMLAAAVASVFSKPVVRTRSEVADTITAFINGTGGPYGWDDFVCGGRIEDPVLEAIRARCAALPDEFPPVRAGTYCNDAGFDVMHGFVRQLRDEA